MSRYSAVPASDGLFLVDTTTGQVTHVLEGGGVRVLYSGPGSDGVIGHAGGTYDAFDEVVLATYPTPLARGWERVLVTNEPRQRALALIDAFTTLAKLWGLAIAAAYLRREELRDLSAYDQIAHAFKRPLISAWPRMIEIGAVLLHDDPDPFVEQLLATYRQCETKCRDKVTVELPFRDIDGTERATVSSLGLVGALVSFRNQVAHAPGRPAAAVEKDLSVYEPAMKRLLAEASFMSRVSLVEVVNRRKGQTHARLWMGRRGGAAEKSYDSERLPVEIGEFALVDEMGASPALPLVWFCASGATIRAPDEMLLYEGRTRRGVRYMTLVGEHHDIRGPLAALETMLEARAPERRATALERLEWAAVLDAARACTGELLNALRQSGSFTREMSIEREVLRLGFEELTLGHKTALVVAGDPGAGKTTALARWAAELGEAGDAVFFYRLGGGGGVSLSERLRIDLGLDRPPLLGDLAQRLAAKVPEDRRVWLIVDGMDEASELTSQVVANLQEWVTECAARPQLKLIASVRLGAYRRQSNFRDFGSGAREAYVQRRDEDGRVAPVVVLGRFTDDELAVAYARTREASVRLSTLSEVSMVSQRPNNGFSTLDPAGTTLRLMSTPVVMRLLMQAYDGIELPSDVSLREAMALFVEHVVVGQNADEDGGARRLDVLRGLVREMERRQTDLLPLDDLYDVAALAQALRATGADSPYEQLRDRGLVVQRMRDGVHFVQLGSVQLLEYLLAQQVSPTVRTVERFLLTAKRALEFSALRGALEQSAHVSLADDGPRLIVDLLDACDDDNWSETREVVLDVVGRLMLGLARLGDASLSRLLDVLQERPSLTDAALLMQMTDRAESLGYAEASKAFLAALAGTVERLDAGPLRGPTRVRQVRSLYARGKFTDAVELADKDDVECERGDAADLAFWRGRALVELGHQVRARAIADLKRAYELSLAEGREARASEARRWWGVALGRAGDTEGYEAAIDEALELAQRAGDRLAEAGALHYVARRAAGAGELDRAEELYDRVRRLATSEGDVKLAGAAWSDLAIVRQQQGRLGEARAAFASALTAFERAQAPRLLCSTLAALSLLEREAGELSTAAELVERAANTSRQLNAPAMLLLALWMRGDVLLDAGHHEAAAACLAELDALSLQGTDALKREVWSAALAGRMALARGSDGGGVEAVRARLKTGLQAPGLPALQPHERPSRALADLGMEEAPSA